jgi:hypothetical protein
MSSSSYNDLDIVEEQLHLPYAKNPSGVFSQKQSQHQHAQQIYVPSTPIVQPPPPQPPTAFNQYYQMQTPQQQQAFNYLHQQPGSHMQPTHFHFNRATPTPFTAFNGLMPHHHQHHNQPFQHLPSQPSQTATVTPPPPPQPQQLASLFNYKHDMMLNENNSIQFSKPKLIRNTANNAVLPSSNTTPTPLATLNPNVNVASLKATAIRGAPAIHLSSDSIVDVEAATTMQDWVIVPIKIDIQLKYQLPVWQWLCHFSFFHF